MVDIDPRMRVRIRIERLQQMLPAWAKRAACAELEPNHAPLGTMFTDDVAYRRDGDYSWPDGVRHAMAVCATCPVRMECLRYAYESERREHIEWWGGELIDERRRYGVYGGVPGRIRERFADEADPIAACDAWFTERFGDARSYAAGDA